MQEILYANGFHPALRFHFAGGRSYMMRSEKRSGGASGRSPAPEGRPPRRRRRRAGFFYKLLTVLLLLILWPVGLMLLWRRKLRWGAATKLLVSVVTLAACVVLFGFALTVNTGNERYTALQDSVNSFLDSAADALIDFGGTVGERAVQVWDGASDFADALWTGGRTQLADGLDWGVRQAEKLKSTVAGQFKSGSEEGDAPEDGASPAPDAEASEAPGSEELPTQAPTSAPVVEVRVEAQDETLPLYIPDAAPDPAGGRPVTEGLLSRRAIFQEGPVPTPEPTPAPTPEPLIFDVKSAAEATVYYFDGSKFYHMATNCGSMKNAPAHSFAEAVESGHGRCNGCKSPEKDLLDETYIVWLDGKGVAHLSDECPDFSGAWKLLSAQAALEAENAACPACGAERYLAAIAAGEEVTIAAPTPEPTPTAEPTMEPTAEPTEAPTVEPTEAPTDAPSAEPTEAPGAEPTAKSVLKPAAIATAAPTDVARPAA